MNLTGPALSTLYRIKKLFRMGMRFSLTATCRRAVRHYLSEQFAFVRRRSVPKLRTVSVWRYYTLPTDYVVADPPSTPHRLQRLNNVDVVSERQYVISGHTLWFHKHRPRSSLRMIDHFFPAFILYQIDVDKLFGFIGYPSGMYFHDVVEYFFSVYLLLRERDGAENIPVLWRGIPSGASAQLIEVVSEEGHVVRGCAVPAVASCVSENSIVSLRN